MKFNHPIHNRRSIRLKGYDYSISGEYFITICTNKKEPLLGEIIEEKMRLSQIGAIAQYCWEEIPKHFPYVELDTFMVMPNHIHGIIVIKEHRRDVQLNVPTTRISPKRGSLAVIIRTFKAAVTTECRHQGCYRFSWQSRFYDRIIRDEKELNNIREYIINNPLQWFFDEENTKRDR